MTEKPQMSKPTTALLLVDVINSFFEAGHPNYYAGVEDVLQPMRQLRDAARASGAVTVHAVERHRPEFHDFEWKKLPIHHLADAHDADYFQDFRPEGANETSVFKRRFSAFFATDLALFLTEQKVERVIIAGVKTNVCIRATAQDAFANGFEPIIVREATNSNRPHLAEASLEDIDRYMGRVVGLAEGLEMLT
jgi:nicotinamidase-related amidase